MDVELGVEQKRLPPPDARKRAKEVINQRGILTTREFFEIGKSERWDFGLGVDALDYLVAQESLGKIQMLQPFPNQKASHDIYVVSYALLHPQESPRPL